MSHDPSLPVLTLIPNPPSHGLHLNPSRILALHRMAVNDISLTFPSWVQALAPPQCQVIAKKDDVHRNWSDAW